MNIANFRLKEMAVGNDTGATMTWPQLGVGVGLISAAVYCAMSFGDLKTSILINKNGLDQILVEMKQLNAYRIENRSLIDAMNSRMASEEMRIQRLERLAKIRQ